ncbi:helix-hairpin-helix domain-containing protein [Clostridium aestuarii]|uniref:Helix-hairpin-helix domain-containing protein n=1 Tax=Clostridium aestuarii TaxID=338193 RepID=A0ABT4CZ67_9CLOT|nr:helix-hairpin-helix domain-containing protein [Clostridium aestuarii]MCY6484271.1 helix-hairpin-helix domain-containing protein [Clostridium aestuarii]
MLNREKLIGSIAMIVGCTIFLIVGCLLSKPQCCNNEDIFVSSSNKKFEKNDKVIVDNSKENNLNDNINSNEYKNIVVEIKGEVKKPNVYTVEYGSRVKDLVEKAGGFTDKADSLSINCSMKLKDEDCIIVYSKNQIKNSLKVNTINISNSISNAKSSNKININTATKEELKTLPGVGDTIAQKIIDYREENGEFSSIDDLTQIDRVGSKTLAKLKDKIEAR